LSTSGIIIAYLDGATGVFDASYLMFNRPFPGNDGAELLEREQRMASNDRVARIALGTFWGEDAAVLDVDWALLGQRYAADYQLHIEDDGRLTTFATTDDLPVARLLEAIRTDIVFTHPNITVEVMEVYASGSFVYVDAALNIQSPNDERSTSLSIVYRLENGVIAEEWWTTEQEIFAFDSAD
jgi:hypothetical protein